MLMSLRTRSTSGCAVSCASASTPLCANRKSKRPSLIWRRKRCRISSSRSGSSSTTRILVGMVTPGQHDDELGELASLGLDRETAAVPLDEDIVGDRQAEAGALARGLGGEEG